MEDYEKQVADFCRETGTAFTFRRVGTVYGFPGEKEDRRYPHLKYRVTITRGGKKFTTPFYGSTQDYFDNKGITRYDVLACLQKYDPGDFWDFVSEFGYSTEGKENYQRAERIYKDLCKEWEDVKYMFGDVLDKLQEIQ